MTKPLKSGHLQKADNFDQTHGCLLFRGLTIFKERQTQIQEVKKGISLKKEQHEFVFRIQSNIYDGAFLRKLLTTKCFIVDIRPGSKHPSN